MKEIKTTIYECEFCKRYYKLKHFAVIHEDFCTKNPVNKPKCYGCKYLEKVDVMLNVEIECLGEYYGIEYTEVKRGFSLLKCTKKDTFIIPIISHKKGKCFEPNLLEEINEMVAPLECSDFKEDTFS